MHSACHHSEQAACCVCWSSVRIYTADLQGKVRALEKTANKSKSRLEKIKEQLQYGYQDAANLRCEYNMKDNFLQMTVRSLAHR